MQGETGGGQKAEADVDLRQAETGEENERADQSNGARNPAASRQLPQGTAEQRADDECDRDDDEVGGFGHWITDSTEVWVIAAGQRANRTERVTRAKNRKTRATSLVRPACFAPSSARLRVDAARVSSRSAGPVNCTVAAARTPAFVTYRLPAPPPYAIHAAPFVLPMFRLPRWVAAAALVVLVFALSGCVYIRLLQLKHQLADFDRNFEVETGEGLSIICKNPVLLDEDVETFFHWVPDSRRQINTAERWDFRWVKDRVAADGDRPPAEISVDLVFSNHKLVKLHAPENFFAATLPKSLALAALRSLGGAKVDRGNRRADSTLASEDLATAAADRFLTEDGVTAALGAPVTRAGSAAEPEWQYRFTPVSKHQRFGDSGVLEVLFRFDPATHHVRLMKGKTAFGAIVFDTTHVGPGDTGHMVSGLPAVTK